MLFWDFDDEGAHGRGRAGDRYGVLDCFAGNSRRVDDAGFLDVDETLVGRHDVDALACLGSLDLGQ